jgi:DNA-binding response OmpR family regulator
MLRSSAEMASSGDRSVVLVVDDDPTLLRLLTAVLTQHGYTAIAAPDGATALRLSRERNSPIHLAILDVIMPRMYGPEVFERLQERHPKMGVLFMSGYRLESLSPIFVESANRRFIGKPFDTKDLLHRVNAILGEPDIRDLPGVESESRSA